MSPLSGTVAQNKAVFPLTIFWCVLCRLEKLVPRNGLPLILISSDRSRMWSLRAHGKRPHRLTIHAKWDDRSQHSLLFQDQHAKGYSRHSDGKLRRTVVKLINRKLCQDFCWELPVGLNWSREGPPKPPSALQ